KELDETLTQARLPHAYFKMDDVDEYLHVLTICTDITQRQDLYEQYGSAVKLQMDEILEGVPADGAKPKILLIRSMSTKAKALKEDHMTGRMLEDLGADNIASRHDSLLEDLSLETILDENPDFIFVVTTGNVDSAIQTLENGMMANPAWNSLSAVQNDRYYVLPKDLFQYKPNARWGEGYEYLYKILYP
ncbi:MAG TPA: ABC transporter substrate-binding protein, partial [Ruminiclostridium sp.]|nr:ABC transporter substrate-binding protein [Ruminiclostridium sp.]